MFSGAYTNFYKVKFKSVWHVRIRIFDNFLVSKRTDQKLTKFDSDFAFMSGEFYGKLYKSLESYVGNILIRLFYS